jgi:hypothetical protein
MKKIISSLSILLLFSSCCFDLKPDDYEYKYVHYTEVIFHVKGSESGNLVVLLNNYAKDTLFNQKLGNEYQLFSVINRGDKFLFNHKQKVDSIIFNHEYEQVEQAMTYCSNIKYIERVKDVNISSNSLPTDSIIKQYEKSSNTTIFDVYITY